MKLKSILSFIIVGGFLAGIGLFLLTEPGVQAASVDNAPTSVPPDAGPAIEKTPVVTVTDIPLADASVTIAN